jgi:hypothetical protein
LLGRHFSYLRFIFAFVASFISHTTIENEGMLNFFFISCDLLIASQHHDILLKNVREIHDMGFVYNVRWTSVHCQKLMKSVGMLW